MKKVIKISILIIALCAIISIPTYAKSGKVVNTNKVRFREKASATEDSTILGEVTQGTVVEIIDQVTGWYKVNYDGKTGYINASYLEEIKEEQSNQETVVPQETTLEPIEEPSKEVKKDKYMITEKTSIKIRPLINSINISTIDKDKECEVIAKAGKWVYIKTSTIKGWVLSSKVSMIVDNNQVSENTTQTKIGYVNLSSINVRRKPTTDSELVAQLTLNTEVKILGEDGDWYLVELNGEKVYIYKELLSDSKVTTTSRSSDQNRAEVAQNATSVSLSEEKNIEKIEQVVSNTGITGEDVVKYAKQYLGYPYVYATAGPNTFDCSGFTSYVYKHFGYSISRSSSEQKNDGVEVSKSNLQLGDIIIFYNTRKTAIGHVGIYVGDNKFIHASSSTTGVIISDLSSANYPQRYVTARRILK